ncbi:MAG: glutamate 5-kinase [Oscillospiraceae bacterium]|nr:glutamate 5-kinase [Oscillospiraceae bacterium]
MKDYKRIVVKVGTSTLTDSKGRLNLRLMDKLVLVLSDLKNNDIEVVLVTSGAIGTGLAALNKPKPAYVQSKQAAAAVGQCRLMHIYDKLFTEYNYNVAQILVTRSDLTELNRNEAVLKTLKELLKWKVVPIINENDSVSQEEIHSSRQNVFGDNDTLSALVAALVKADLLVLLTDIDAFYTADPRENPDAKRIPRVTDITDKMKLASGGAGSARGTGGMITKLAAAEIALEKGFTMAVAHGKDPAVLYKILNGEDIGTIFER